MDNSDHPEQGATEQFADTVRQELTHAHLAQARMSLLLYHRDGTEVLPIGVGVDFTIGRDAPSDLQIRDPSLSRQHARVSVTDSGVWIEDLDSTNGTFVNGKQVKQSQVQLTDRVALGAVVLVLHALGGAQDYAVDIESHDQLMRRLDEERARARGFSRGFSLVMLKARRKGHEHVSHWIERVRRQLRPVDRVALYTPDCIEALLPEATAEQAEQMVGAMVKSAKDYDLASGIAVYPDDATSVGALVDACRKTLQRGRRTQRRGTSNESTSISSPATGIVVASDATRALWTSAERVASSDLPILVLGETGTGKEILAQHIHAKSPRSKGRLVPLNCGAIVQELVESTLFGHERGAFTGADQRRAGVLEAAKGGTVLLDEIGELPLEAQVALLRVLETKRITRVGSSQEVEIDVRILAATHRDLEQMCNEGTFREDLFYRLNAITLTVPPLRDRREEIDPLVEQFLDAACRANHIDRCAIDAPARSSLLAYHWPGNIRELRNVIERAVVISRGGTITPDDLPERVRHAALSTTAGGIASGPGINFQQRVEQFERQLILEALRTCAWNQTRAAEQLSMPRRTLVHKIKAYDIRKLGFS